MQNSNGYEKAELFRLGGPGWGEDFVQDLIAEDPSILGLGELVVKEKERKQSGGGRLDFLLQDSPLTSRYEVEVQLGDTNPSHIIRTIEYWDRERRNSPLLQHIAVIVAEGINQRFFNVISLFNQHIPLIAIKMAGVEVGGKKSIVFVKVLDHSPKKIGDDEEAGAPETNRAYWEAKTSHATMNLLDEIVGIAQKIDPNIGPRYKKVAVPLKKGSEFWRFLTLYPKKKHIRILLPLSQSQEIETQLSDADIDFDYNPTRGWYLLNVTPASMPKQSVILTSLIEMAYERSKEDSVEAEED